MKKMIAAVVVSAFILISVCACQSGGTNTSLPEISDFSDFVSMMEESGFKPQVSFIEVSGDESETEESVPENSVSEESKPEESKPEESKPEESKPEEKPEYGYTTGQKHTALKNTDRYLYSILNAQQKEWYRKIDAAVKALEEKVCLDTSLTENNNYYIFYIYAADNPELFYLGVQIGVEYGTGKDSLLFTYSDGTANCGLDYGSMTPELKQSILAKKARFDAEIQRIVSTIPADAPDVIKEKLIYDRILIDSSYKQGAVWDGTAPDPWSAYGVIINHTGVCESYAEAFHTLCFMVGINCVEVVGTGNGENHKWSAVRLDGEWYMCDVTFDDPTNGKPGETRHEYFNLTTVQMQAKKHAVLDMYWKTPSCNGTKYSYENYFGK